MLTLTPALATTGCATAVARANVSSVNQRTPRRSITASSNIGSVLCKAGWHGLRQGVAGCSSVDWCQQLDARNLCILGPFHELSMAILLDVGEVRTDVAS